MIINTKAKNILYLIADFLIIVDIILIINLLFFDHSSERLIWAFDVMVCSLLLLDYFIKLYLVKGKKKYVKGHLFELIASIPLEFISPIFILLRFQLITRLIKIFRVSSRFSRFFTGWNKFLESTKLDKILTWIIFTVIIFTFALYFFDPGINLFDSLWFVVVTLTTVGYGDVIPATPLAKATSIMLLVLGIFIFSTLTGAISSYFTDKVLNIDSDTEEGIEALKNKVDCLEKELADISMQLEMASSQNQELAEKIDELLKK